MASGFTYVVFVTIDIEELGPRRSSSCARSALLMLGRAQRGVLLGPAASRKLAVGGLVLGEEILAGQVLGGEYPSRRRRG